MKRFVICRELCRDLWYVENYEEICEMLRIILRFVICREIYWDLWNIENCNEICFR